MNEPKRRFLEWASLQGSPSPTFIPAGTVILGDIRGEGQFMVCGEVHGDGDIKGSLVLAATARWIGNIRVNKAIIAGTIVGGIVAQDKIEIGRAAVIRGHVSACTVAIAKGAIVEGAIEVTSGDPMLVFEEKRGDSQEPG